MACPDLIVKGEELLALVQTWFVAIIPTEYTSHVLLPRLKIWPGRGSPTSLERCVFIKTIWHSQKKVEPRCLQLEVGGRKSLESLHVSDGNEISFADIRDD